MPNGEPDNFARFNLAKTDLVGIHDARRNQLDARHSTGGRTDRSSGRFVQARSCDDLLREAKTALLVPLDGTAEIVNEMT